MTRETKELLDDAGEEEEECNDERNLHPHGIGASSKLCFGGIYLSKIFKMKVQPCSTHPVMGCHVDFRIGI